MHNATTLAEGDTGGTTLSAGVDSNCIASHFEANNGPLLVQCGNTSWYFYSFKEYLEWTTDLHSQAKHVRSEEAAAVESCHGACGDGSQAEYEQEAAVVESCKGARAEDGSAKLEQTAADVEGCHGKQVKVLHGYRGSDKTSSQRAWLTFIHASKLSAILASWHECCLEYCDDVCIPCNLPAMHKRHMCKVVLNAWHSCALYHAWISSRYRVFHLVNLAKQVLKSWVFACVMAKLAKQLGRDNPLDQG